MGARAGRHDPGSWRLHGPGCDRLAASPTGPARDCRTAAPRSPLGAAVARLLPSVNAGYFFDSSRPLVAPIFDSGAGDAHALRPATEDAAVLLFRRIDPCDTVYFSEIP